MKEVTPTPAQRLPQPVAPHPLVASYPDLGFALVPIPLDSKGPTLKGWQELGVTRPEQIVQWWGTAPLGNVGLLHSQSRTAALDIDHPDYAARALEGVGIDLQGLLAAPGAKIRTAKAIKPLYQIPEGCDFTRKALTWPHPETGRPFTLFELRAGACQDILPPSTHPDTGQLYTWHPAPPTSRDDLPFLPEALLHLWEGWSELKPLLEALCPWSSSPPPRCWSGPDGSVIGLFNERYTVTELLERHGYVRYGERFLSPASTTGVAGVVLMSAGDGTPYCYSHHASDPLADGHAHDAFGVHCLLEHGGDVKKAVRHAAGLLSMSRSHSPPHERESPWDARVRDLRDVGPETPTLPAVMVPAPLRAWIEDAAERACLHREYLAVPALSAAGSLIGRTVGLHPKRFDDWLEVPLLWGAVVGPPSSLKTAGIMEGTAPLRVVAARARDAYEGARLVREADREVLKLELEATKRGARSGKDLDAEGLRDALQTKLRALAEADPSEPRYLTQDATAEKLGELLRDNPRGLLVLRDELTGLLQTMRKTGHEGDRAFYLEAWNGRGSYTVDRVGRGTLHVPALALTLLGGVQPGRLRSYVLGAVAGEAEADGLLQRFQLLVWPDQPPPWRRVDRPPDSEAKARVAQVFATLDTLDPAAMGASPHPHDPDGLPGMHFDSLAQELFDAWLDDLMPRLRGDELAHAPAFSAHLAKYPALMARLSLTFHLLEVADGLSAKAVSPESANLAINWCTYLEGHARKVYAPELDTALLNALTLAEKLEQGEVSDGTPLRQVYRHGWQGLTTPKAVSEAAHVLEQAHWVRVERVPAGSKGGRPHERLRLHPELREG